MTTLATMPWFALGKVSVGGIMSPGERKLRDILKRDDATATLQSIFAHGTPAAQLYALLGLRLHDRAAYDAALKTVRRDDPLVEFRQGCGAEKDHFSTLLADLIAGKYDEYLSRPEW